MLASIIKLSVVRWSCRFLLKLHSVFWDRFISSLKFRALIKRSGAKSYCHHSVEIKYGNNICIGDYTRIGPKATLGAMESITIGSNVVISKEVFIETAGLDFKEQTIPYKHKARAITINDNVWIGARAIILGGVVIGENSIIGAGAIVTKSVPKNSIVIGPRAEIKTIEK